jgi:hypothetical protein
MVLQDPPGDYVNWAIGCNITTITNVGDMTTEPLGFVESKGKHITAIPSLFAAQLKERLAPLSKKDQTISFNSLPIKTFGDPDFMPVAFASSALAVNFVSSDTSIASIINGYIHIRNVGTCEIIALQKGDTFFNAAPDIAKILTVSKRNQSITFLPLADKVVGDSDFNPGAAASSGLMVSYTSSDLSVVSVSSDLIHIEGPGIAFITASQSGDSITNTAADVQQSIAVAPAPKLSQAISFEPIPNCFIGSPDFNPNASANSGLPVTYLSSDTAVARILNGMIHIDSIGITTITASQTGDAMYEAATDVSRTMLVTFATSISSPDAEEFTFSTFPNPASKELCITYKSNKDTEYQLFIYNTTGQAIKQLDLKEQIFMGICSRSIDITDLENGLYYIKFCQTGIPLAGKIIIISKSGF